MQPQPRPAFRVSLTAIVLFQVAALFARSMLDLRLRRGGMDAAVANDLSYLVVPPILLVLMLPYLRRCKDSLGRLFDRRRLTLRVVACSVALGLTLRLMWWASTTFLIGIGAFRNEDPEAVVGPIIGFGCPPPAVLMLSFAVMAMLVPVTEELVHRGYVLYAALPFGRHVAVIGSAAFFALMHPVASYAATFAGGLALAMQALNYRALWGPIVTHATYNAAAVVDWDCFSLIWNPSPDDPLLLNLAWLSIPTMVAGGWLVTLLVQDKGTGANSPRP